MEKFFEGNKKMEAVIFIFSVIVQIIIKLGMAAHNLHTLEAEAGRSL